MNKDNEIKKLSIDEFIDDNKKMNKKEYPTYPYKHPNVPGNYILVLGTYLEELIWVHPCTIGLHEN